MHSGRHEDGAVHAAQECPLTRAVSDRDGCGVRTTPAAAAATAWTTLASPAPWLVSARRGQHGHRVLSGGGGPGRPSASRAFGDLRAVCAEPESDVCGV